MIAWPIVPQRWHLRMAEEIERQRRAPPDPVAEDIGECPACGGTILKSLTDPDDPYWYCVEDDCDWQGTR